MESPDHAAGEEGAGELDAFSLIIIDMQYMGYCDNGRDWIGHAMSIKMERAFI
jgi:hypothetical protein